MEILSRSLQIEQKLFYLDLKDNPRGRFLKISEKNAMNRSTIIVPLAGVVWFVDLFNYYANGASGTELSSKELQLDTKIFYFDVGENPRGRFLKVSEASMARPRSTIIVPAGGPGADGWAAFRNVLVEVHEASVALPMPVGAAGGAGALAQDGYAATAAAAPATAAAAAAKPMPAAAHAAGGAGDAAADSTASAAAVVAGVGAAPSTLASRVIRADQKKFFLDLGSNPRGQFLRISEVLGGDRSAVMIPASALEQIHEALGQFMEIIKTQPAAAGGVPVRTLNPPQSKRTDS